MNIFYYELTILNKNKNILTLDIFKKKIEIKKYLKKNNKILFCFLTSQNKFIIL